MARLKQLGFAVVALGVSSTATHATWSICITDSSTKEVAVGTVTCLNQFDLLSLVPASGVAVEDEDIKLAPSDRW